MVGIGNPLRGDDAAGLLVARRAHELDPRLDVLELEGEPSRLIDAWQEADPVVVVDAVSSGAEPGTVMRFDATAEPLPASLSAASTHALGLGEAIEIARALDRLPARLVVFAIEGAGFEAGREPSPEVRAAIEPTARRVLAEARPEAPRVAGKQRRRAD